LMSSKEFEETDVKLNHTRVPIREIGGSSDDQ
jgi:hypothetical protein